MSHLSILSNGSFLGAVTLKSLTTAAIYSVGNKYLNDYSWKDSVLFRGFIASFASAGVAELLMISIIQKLLALGGSNPGMKRIFDQGLNAALSGGLNIKAYDLLVKSAPNIEGSKWMNHEEFLAQLISDIIGEVLSYYYLVPLFGLNQTNIMTVYG